MKIFIFNLLFLTLFLNVSDNTAQDSNNVNYSLFLEKSVIFGTLDTKVAGGTFTEGNSFTIPATTLPSTFSLYQELYNALVGGTFGIEYGALDKDIIMKVYLRNLNPNLGIYKNLGVDGDTLFSYFEIKIWELPDSHYFPVDSNYYFNEGFHAIFSLPKSDNFKSFLNFTGIGNDDSLGFAFLEQNLEGNTIGDDWNSSGIETIETDDSIIFKTIHLSRIGGGRKRSIVDNKSVSTDIEIQKIHGIPIKIELEQNYPNPFNPSTNILYSLPTGSNVKLNVFNILGEQIAALVNAYQTAGKYQVTFSTGLDNSLNSSGIYFYTLEVDKQKITRKMILVK